MVVYCICSIRHRSYYLFHHVILCGFYSRVATNWEWHLLNSVLFMKLVKSFVNIRALRKSFIKLTKNYNAMAWFWSKPSSFLISRCFATKRYLHGTSNSQWIASSSNPIPLQMLKRTKMSWRRMNLYRRTANLLYVLWVLASTVPIVCTLCMFWYCHLSHEVCSRVHVLLEY